MRMRDNEKENIAVAAMLMSDLSSNLSAYQGYKSHSEIVAAVIGPDNVYIKSALFQW